MNEPVHSVRSLIDAFAAEFALLCAQTMALAQAEVAASASRVGRYLAVVVAGVMVAALGVIALVAAAVLIVIELGARPWVAASLVGGLFLVAGAVITWRALVALRTTEIAPRRTLESLREDAAWLKQQVAK